MVRVWLRLACWAAARGWLGEAVLRRVPVTARPRHKVAKSVRRNVERRQEQPAGGRKAGRLSVNAPLVDCKDTIYYGSIGLGTPTQTLQVILDTGSSDFWVASTDCDESCDGLDLFDGAKSSTYVADTKSFYVGYLDGDSVSGHRSYETVHWAGLAIQRQGFAEVGSVGDFYICEGEDGLLGMAAKSLSRLGVTPPFMSLVEEGALDANIFAFRIGGVGDPDGGELTLGGVDPTQFTGTLGWVPVLSPFRLWECNLNGVTFGGVNLDT
ncbi:aspartic peptidase domain-containing protein, partial [Pelagophyceae sp. CCMP2097]